MKLTVCVWGAWRGTGHHLAPGAPTIICVRSQAFFIFSSPLMEPGLVEGCEALVFTFSFLGLRASRFDFCPLDMVFPIGAECPARSLRPFRRTLA